MENKFSSFGFTGASACIWCANAPISHFVYNAMPTREIVKLKVNLFFHYDPPLRHHKHIYFMELNRNYRFNDRHALPTIMVTTPGGNEPFQDAVQRTRASALQKV